MNEVLKLNLIHFLDFYFALMFVASTWRRWGQYHSAAQLVLAGPGRWPHLMKLVRQYRTIFWTWSTVMPALLAFGLWMIQMFMSRFVMPEAGTLAEGLTIQKLLEHWPALILVVPIGVAMFGFDFYSWYVVGKIDRPMLEKYFDQAEYWLQSKTAHVIRVVTFGRINPRRMVAEEVEKALLSVSEMLNFTLWWVNLQIGLRFGFGLSLWVTWAVTH